MPALQQKTMASQKVAAYLKLAQENEGLWNAVLIFLGTLFLLGAIPFYPLYVVPLLALVCGAVGFRLPWAGTLLSMLLAFPAMAYQSAIFAWIFIFLLAVVIFEMIENWRIISTLQILIMAPFSFNALPFFGWITVLGMFVASLHFGSRKSLFISLPAVFLILLLSSIWLVDNSAFMPIHKPLYEPALDALKLSKPILGLMDVPRGIGNALPSLFAPEVLTRVTDTLGLFVRNILRLLFSDSGIIQLAAWAVALYAASYLSGQFKHRSQLIASFSLLIIPMVYYVISIVFPVSFHFGLLGAVALSIALAGISGHLGLTITREVEIERGEKQKAYSKFGVQDLALGKGEKSLADVGDYEDVKQELLDAILLPLEKKELSFTYGIKPPSGILLFGPPGTGKTMLMRALAKELRYGFYYIKSSDILSMWYGESEKNVSEIFSIAQKSSPSILFFDEIDSIGKKRTMYGSDDVAPRVLSVLLQEMDGMKTGKPILVVGATNVPHQLDPALLRPGRFDKIIYMHLPPPEARAEIFRVHLRKVPLADDIDFEKLTRKTNRFSGADIKNAVQEAVNLAAKEASRSGKVIPVSISHLLKVLSTIKPSTSIAALDDYERFKLDFERRVGGKEEEKPREDIVKWEDVAGLADVKDALLEAIQLPLLHEEEMQRLNVKPSKGILLYGPPGTGKTLIAKAASNELKASFQVLSGAELLREGYGRAVGVIKEIFNRARENTPAIIFVDEIETIAPARGSSGIGNEILGQFLTELDGIRELKGVVLIGATNRPGIMDPAILRPGRFDKLFYIPPPDKATRVEVFRIHLGQFATDANLDKLAGATEGYSGADIAAICQDIKMQVLRKKIAGKEFRPATDDVLESVQSRRPSITPDLLKEFDHFMEMYGSRERKKRKGDDSHYR
ncbi:MAG TPA: AAA family ATPase [Candidatus Bilamarchaeaceae archaeon]|nr:AAA family ATPase [Candidatus Bilamarchaeaceae archaeon]